MTYALVASLISNDVLQYGYIDQVAQNIRALGIHDHSGSLGEGSNVLPIGTCNISGSLSYRIEITPFDKPVNIGGNYVFSQQTKTWPFFRYREDTNGSGLNGSTYLNHYIFVSTCRTPAQSEWGFIADAGTGYKPGASSGVYMHLYIPSGSFNLTMFYTKNPKGGTLSFRDNASTIWAEQDTYGAACASATFNGTFYNSGSIPYILHVYVGASKNVSATACELWMGAMCVQWVGS